jgi:hypothetical protein
MKVRQLRATLEEFATIYESAGHREKAAALQALSRALSAADTKNIDQVIPFVQRATTVAKTVDQVASR